MSVTIVVAFEIVHIDEQQAHVMPLAAGMMPDTLEVVVEALV